MCKAATEKLENFKIDSNDSTKKWFSEKKDFQKNIKDLKKKLKDSQIRYQKLMIQNQTIQKK